MNPTNRILMCAPDHFNVAYVINPWMKGNVACCDPVLAMRQWQELARAIGRVASVETVRGGESVPDMVFTANAGLVLGQKVVLSHFRHPERQAEEALFADWFALHGLEVEQLPGDMYFEGAGDALLDRSAPVLWLGFGHRSDAACAPLLAQSLQIEVQGLRLVNPHFYHLDTCFCPLDGGFLLYHPEAFDAAARKIIAARVPASRRIAVDAADAAAFACNAVSIGRHVFLNAASDKLLAALQAHGYQVHVTPLSEFMKAGGAAKCLTLKLDEPGQSQWPAPAWEEARETAGTAV
ncbi:MAG: nitrate reductase [Paucimonas sp.]|nr:nitrate reductase [Paucimonas sp.]